jgi:predicted amidohydrolase
VAGGWLDLCMITPVPTALQTKANATVLAWLADKSAHDEVASALLGATRPLGDVLTYCPDPKQFRYVVTATRGIIFGVATGMSAVSFRLDREMHQRALQSGAEAVPEIGPDWVSFTLFRSDWPTHDLAFWALKAYALARGNA